MSAFLNLLLFFLMICGAGSLKTFLKIGRNLKSSSLNEASDDDIDLSKLVKLSDDERLQKVIARAGLASRRAAEKLILDGRVMVNGKIVTELGTKVKPKKDMIQVDGTKILLPDVKSTFWVVVNKPKSVLTTVEDDKDRETILSLVPRSKELRLLPVGRLERDATGVMILTNENGWIHPLTHPSFGIKRRYEIVVQGLPTEENLEILRSGALLSEGDKLPPCDISVIDHDKVSGLSLVDIALKESRPKQLQSMMDLISCPMVSMKRTEYGPIQIKGLRKGQWRELSISEIQKLKASCQKAAENRVTKKPIIATEGIQPNKPKSVPEVRRSKFPGHKPLRSNMATGVKSPNSSSELIPSRDPRKRGY